MRSGSGALSTRGTNLPTAFIMKAVGTEWVTPGLPRMNRTKNSEYVQEIPQSQTADNALAPSGRAAQPSRDTRKTN